MHGRHRCRLACLLLAVMALLGPARALVPDDLLDQRTCGIGALSPDGRLLIYTVGVYEPETASQRSSVHLWNLETGSKQILFTPDDHADSFAFSPDGATLAFLRQGDEGSTLWLMNADGTARQQITGPARHGALIWSPDGAYLAHLVNDRVGDYPGKPGVVTVADDLGWRHLALGEREGQRRQLHLVDVATGEDRVLPLADHDVREVAWSPDGARLVVSAKARTDLGRTLDTDLFVIQREGSAFRRLIDTPGPDTMPLWFEEGAIACQSHPDSLHESEPAHLVVRDAATGRETERLLTGFDNCVWGIWQHGDTFYFRGAHRGSASIFRVTGASGEQLTPTGWNFWDIRFGGDRAILYGNSQTSPGQLFDLDLRDGTLTSLFDPNERWLERARLVEPQRFEVTVEGRVIEGWVYLPEDHLPGHRLPTVLSIHGGPEWMYGGYFLPEFHVLPSFGYAVIAANPTGSTGYGRAFMEDIRGDWTGRPARELMAVVDHAVAEGWSDPDLLAVMGGSYGGHLAAALTTQTDRFRAAAVDRMYPQAEAFWGATDEKWFPEWEFGGRPFDDDARAIYARNNPFLEIARVTTPTLVSHGLRDYRCPQDGSVGWFSALQSLGVPSRLLRFHHEGHGIRGRANQVFYLEQLLGWFEHWVLEDGLHE